MGAWRLRPTRSSSKSASSLNDEFSESLLSVYTPRPGRTPRQRSAVTGACIRTRSSGDWLRSSSPSPSQRASMCGSARIQQSTCSTILEHSNTQSDCMNKMSSQISYFLCMWCQSINFVARADGNTQLLLDAIFAGTCTFLQNFWTRKAPHSGLQHEYGAFFFLTLFL